MEPRQHQDPVKMKCWIATVTSVSSKDNSHSHSDSDYCSHLFCYWPEEKKFTSEPGKAWECQKEILLSGPQERGDCKYQGSRVCNGAIVKTFRLSSLVRVCQEGKLVVRKTSDITAAEFKYSQRISGKRGNVWSSGERVFIIYFQDCSWYGEAFCHGDEVIVS